MTSYKMDFDSSQTRLVSAALSWNQSDLSRAYGDYGLDVSEQMVLLQGAHEHLVSNGYYSEAEVRFIREITTRYAYHLAEVSFNLSQLLPVDVAKATDESIQESILEAQALANIIMKDIL